MKKVRIFLGVALVTIAGAAAAANALKQVNEQIYYFDPADTTIKPYIVQSLACSPNATGCTQVIPGVNGGQPVQLYVFRGTNYQPLKRD